MDLSINFLKPGQIWSMFVLKPWSANTRIYYMARIMVLQEYYWETHRILVETSTERAEMQFYVLFVLY